MLGACHLAIGRDDQVCMRRGTQEKILIENFRPSRYLLDALAAAR